MYALTKVIFAHSCIFMFLHCVAKRNPDILAVNPASIILFNETQLIFPHHLNTCSVPALRGETQTAEMHLFN